MDQSKSTKELTPTIAPPERTLTLEFYVGLFALLGVAAAGYLAIDLGHLKMFDRNTYEIKAEFDNISGLKNGASVEIAGVQVGEVVKIELQDPMAILTMRVDNKVMIRDDDIIAVRSKGIIGDRYVKISRGASDIVYKAGDTIRGNTESVVDFEDIVGKIVHSLTTDSSKEDAKK